MRNRHELGWGSGIPGVMVARLKLLIRSSSFRYMTGGRDGEHEPCPSRG